MNIALIGFKAVGKTTLGKELAKAMNMTFIDLDTVIEEIHQARKDEKKTCREIYNEYGSKYFRDIEKKALSALIDKNETVVALGAGVIEDNLNRSLIKKLDKVIYLKEDKKILFSRIEKIGFPSFFDKENPKKSFDELYSKREKLYEMSAHIVLNCNSLSVEKLCKKIVKLLERDDKNGK